MITPITFPARPINGGKLELAPTKRGVWFAEPKYNYTVSEVIHR